MSNLTEERIRQDLIDRLVLKWNFPSRLLIKERAIHQLPHFHQEGLKEGLPKDRRIDLLAYHWQKERLMPLVLFECKYAKPDKKAFQQLVGYNHWIQAPYLAWVSLEHEGLYRISKEGLIYLGAFQPFEDLCKLLTD